jgi:hypothetical protein
MKTVLAAIGLAVVLMFAFGAIGAADFYLCFRAVGECIKP